MSSDRHGLSLVEVVIVLSLIAVLMALSLPMLSSANTQARSMVCRQNLADMGEIITNFAMDFERMPDLAQAPPEGEAQSLAAFIEPRAHNPGVLFCPSDETDQSQDDGTSYIWDNHFNGLALGDIDQTPVQTLLADREAFHEGSERTSNALVLERTGSRFQFAVASDGESPFINDFTLTPQAPKRHVSDEHDADSADTPRQAPRTSPDTSPSGLIINQHITPHASSPTPAGRFVPLGE